MINKTTLISNKSATQTTRTTPSTNGNGHNGPPDDSYVMPGTVAAPISKMPPELIEQIESEGEQHLSEILATVPPPPGGFWSQNPPGEYGNSLCFREVYGEKLGYCSAYGWLYHAEQERKWLTGDFAESKIDKAIIETLLERQRQTAQVNNEIASKAGATTRNISAVLSLTKPYVTVSPDEFDNDPNLLNTKSGVIDLRSGKIVADESGKFTYCVPTSYLPDTDYSQWLEWLNLTVEHHETDEAMRDWLQMCLGYSITGHTNEECLFFFHGPPRSGKGTLAFTMQNLLGKPLSATADSSTFTRKRDGNNFDLAPLKPARLVIAPEGKKRYPMNADFIKTITGRDSVRCAFKGKDEFEYDPLYKIWLVSNFPVNADPDDDAFWTRVKVITCPWSKAGKEDKHMKNRMAQPDFLRAVLAYTVLGAKMWANEPNGLVTPDCVRKATQTHRDANDSVGMWLADNCTDSVKADHWVGSTKLYADYENWCEENGFTPKKGNDFAQSMVAKGYEAKRLTSGRGYIGLDLLFSPTRNIL